MRPRGGTVPATAVRARRTRRSPILGRHGASRARQERPPAGDLGKALAGQEARKSQPDRHLRPARPFPTGSPAPWSLSEVS